MRRRDSLPGWATTRVPWHAAAWQKHKCFRGSVHVRLVESLANLFCAVLHSENTQPTSRQDQFHPPPRSHTLPVPTTPAAQHNGYHESGGRPPSSIYSQPSPLNTDFPPRRQPNNAYGLAKQYSRSPDEVSPPSSPELDRTSHMYVRQKKKNLGSRGFILKLYK